MINKYLRQNINKKINFIFLFILTITALVFLICYLSSGRIIFKEITNIHYEVTFTDFTQMAESIFSLNPYNYGDVNNGNFYSPISLILLFPFSRILDFNHFNYISVKNNFLGILIPILFNLIFLALIYFFIYKLMKIKTKKFLLFTFCTLISTPFIFWFERANNVIMSLFFLVIFLYFYKSDKKKYRELSLISLGLAIAIKYYLIFYILILVAEYRLKDSIKAFVYFLLWFFVPFLFIKGGFNNIPALFDNLWGFSSAIKYIKSYDVNGIPNINHTFSHNLSFTNVFQIFFFFFNGFNTFEPPTWYFEVGQNISLILAILTFISVLFLKKNWHRLLLITTITLLWPIASTAYLAIFYLPVIALFFIDDEKVLFDYFFLIMFILILLPIQFGYLFQLPDSSIIIYGNTVKIAPISFVLTAYCGFIMYFALTAIAFKNLFVIIKDNGIKSAFKTEILNRLRWRKQYEKN